MNNIKAGDYVICVKDTSLTTPRTVYIVKNVYKKYISSKDTLFDLVEIDLTTDNNLETGTTIVAVDSKMFEKCDLNYEIGDIVDFIFLSPNEEKYLNQYIKTPPYRVHDIGQHTIGIEISKYPRSLIFDVFYIKKQQCVKINSHQVSEEETDEKTDNDTLSVIDEYIFIPEDEMKFVVVNGVKGYMIKLNEKEES